VRNQLVAVVLMSVALGMSAPLEQGWSAGPPAQPKTRVGLVNLAHVIKKYKKFYAFQEELKNAIDPFHKRDEALKQKVDDLTKESKAPMTSDDRREEIARLIKQATDDATANKQKASVVLTAKQEAQMKVLYTEIREAVRRHAESHGLEVVMHYQDAVDPKELDSAQNISRKMTAGAAIPVYIAPGVDISEEIIVALNTAYERKKP
jgi:Skp family chaperone for outer membrane proteins